jgi:hypothetical protein
VLQRSVIEQSQNVGMLEAAKNFDLAAESLFSNDRRDFRPQDFYGDLGIGLRIIGENYVSSASLADQRLERIPLRQRSDETLDAAGRFLQTIRSVSWRAQPSAPPNSVQNGEPSGADPL